MGIHLRTRPISKGRVSLYIDFYPPIPDGKGGLTRREHLKQFLYIKPKTDAEKKHNTHVKLYADKLLVERQTQKMHDELGTYNQDHKKKDFLEFFQRLSNPSMYKFDEPPVGRGYWYLHKFTNGSCKIGDITEDFCNRYKAFLLSTNMKNSNKKLSRNSIVGYFNKFRAAVRQAYEERLLPTNPITRVKSIPSEETKREFLTQEELNTLIKVECENERLKTAALFAALTGLRWSDLEKLKWMDIQKTETGYFLHIVQKKTKDTIVHPISDKAVLLLGPFGAPHQSVFEGVVYSISNNTKIKRWIQKAGINKKITLHNFRHTYATLLLNNGADIYTVSKMLGHKNIKTTQIYSKVLTETKIRAANLIDIDL